MKTREWYAVHYETWEYNEEDDDYTDGPYDEEDFEVETMDEAINHINDFIKDHPDAKDFKISYDKKDPDIGIIKQKLIRALEYKKGVYQRTIDVFYMKTTY